MQLRPQLQLQVVIKAMLEDVIPALDHDNQLAMQSAQLTIGTLSLIAQHLPLEYRFDCDELARLIAAAKALGARTNGGAQTNAAVAEIELAAANGASVLQRARAEPQEIVAAVRRLRAAASEVARTVYVDADERVQAVVAETLLSMSKEQLLRDRSWLLMQGWEPDPQSVPPIEELLAPLSTD